jgi:endonuclease YncB( thermonuclease family)
VKGLGVVDADLLGLVSVYLPAVVVRVVDGDSLHLNINLSTKPILGFDLWAYDVPGRLARCNAREVNEPGGPEARENLAATLPAGTAVLVRIVGTDEYGGRRLVEVRLGDGTDLVADLVARQWLAPWNGRGPKPVPPWPRQVNV